MTEVAEIVETESLPAEPKSQEIAGSAITPMRMIEMALSNGSGVETIEKLMALQERWEANNARKAFDRAMAAAKAEIPTIVKDQTVDYTHNNKQTYYKYENLASIAAVVDPILAKDGLSYRFRASQNGQMLTVTCIIAHCDGYNEETSLSAQNDTSGGKNGIQSVGSAAAYLQRYTLKLALGLSAAKDDDAQACGKSNNLAPTQQANSQHQPDPGQAQREAAYGWRGPLNKDDLKQKCSTVANEINQIVQEGDLSQLNSYLQHPETVAIIEQLRVDALVWWQGKQGLSGLADHITKSQETLQAKANKANEDTFPGDLP